MVSQSQELQSTVAFQPQAHTQVFRATNTHPAVSHLHFHLLTEILM